MTSAVKGACRDSNLHDYLPLVVLQDQGRLVLLGYHRLMLVLSCSTDAQVYEAATWSTGRTRPMYNLERATKYHSIHGPTSIPELESLLWTQTPRSADNHHFQMPVPNSIRCSS